MNVKVEINGIDSNISTTETGIVVSKDGEEEKYAFQDIIGVEAKPNRRDFILHYMKDHPFPNNKLTREVLCFTSEEKASSILQTEIKDRIQKETERPQKLAVFVNPIGGKGKGKQICDTEVVPLLELAGIQVDVVVSERAGHFKDLTKSHDFEGVDGLVIMGGDGTVSEIMNVLIRETQIKAGLDYNDSNSDIKKTDLPIGVIPTGSACGFAKVCYGVSDIITSTLHIIRGKKDFISTVGGFNTNKLIGYGVMCFGYVMYADLMYDTDVHFRWLRTLRYLFVPLWHLFVKSQRELDVEITYEYLDGSEPNDLSESEKFSLKATRRKRIINVVGSAADLEFHNSPFNQQPELKDQFQMFEYYKCGGLELLRHFSRLSQLSMEQLESEKHFVTHSKIKSVRIQATEDNPSHDRELNLRFNIDGETHVMETPDVYIRIFPRSITVYTSYKGSRHW